MSGDRFTIAVRVAPAIGLYVVYAARPGWKRSATPFMQ